MGCLRRLDLNSSIVPDVSESTVMLQVHFIQDEDLISHRRRKNLKIYFVFLFCVLCAFCGSKLPILRFHFSFSDRRDRARL